jgi:DNA-binding NtrC family response regulator
MRLSAESPPRGTETVLLVEPEPETRKLAAFMLAKQGYQVLEAHNAAEAVRLYEQHGRVDLLFTEAVMSRVNGHDLAKELLSRDPALRVLYLSDAAYERIARGAAAQKGLAFLPRPFTMGALASKVRQVLDCPAALRTSA